VGVVCLAASVAAHGAAALLAVAGHRSVVKESRVAAEPDPHVLAGDTFEVPVDELPAGPTAAEATPDSHPVAPSPIFAGNVARARPHVAAKATAGAPTASDALGEGTRPGLFGAVGDRSATHVAAAFTRGFPQAASADPLWLTAPFGSAGSIDVDLTLDEQGSLVSAQHEGGDAGPALREGLRRTLALIRARAFVADGRVTRLRVTATVSPDEVHDGLHGEVFAIGGSFDGGEGNAFFALAVGRRIDIRVRALR
jgi:hypothetical protein